jgi:protein-tyrosine-phosphatase
MAEVLARKTALELGMKSVEVRSAGTHAGASMPASEGARRAVARHGQSLEAHSPTGLSPELVDWADWIFVMGPGHLHQVWVFGGKEKAVLLGAFAAGEGSEAPGGGGTHLAIPDPFGGDDRQYERTYQTLKRYVELAMKRLAEGVGG